MAATKEPVIKVMKLDADRVNDPAMLKDWDRIWSSVLEKRMTLSLARQTGKTITVEMMQAYEQARNAERQFFWDNFYEQQDS